MRRILAAATLALAACGQAAPDAAPAATSPNDPFANARDGQLLCTSPNESQKTCGSIMQFTFAPNGEVHASGQSIRNLEPLIVSTGPLPIEVTVDGFCATYRSEPADTQNFTIDGVPASPEATASIRADLRSRPNPPQACLSFSATSIQTAVTIDGVAQPEMAERMIWISPDAGYSIGWPPSQAPAQ